MREIARKLSQCSSFGSIMDDAFIRCPERDAVIYDGWRLTYGELERLINRTSHFLQNLGVQKGSRVAILSRNCPEWLIAEFALYRLGAIVVKINWRLTPAEQARILERNRVSVAFFKAEKPEFSTELEQLCTDKVYFIRIEPVNGRSTLCTLVEGEPDTPLDVQISRDDVACRLHTSGTTGEPKCVVYTHGGMLREIVSMLQVYPYPDGQRYQFIAQLFHSAAIGAHLSLATGGTMVLKDHFGLADYMQTLVSERIESISVVPTVLKWILDETDNGDYDLSHLKTINYSTCPIPKALLQRAIDKLHCNFYQSYGMTEMGSTVTALLPEDHLSDGGSHISSVGRPIPGAAVRILAPDGSECPAGVEGEIYVQGPGQMLEYLDAPETTHAVLNNGWYRTKDMGMLDNQGYLFLRGRADDLIISGGENIYPGEITNVIMRLCDDVSEVAVYGVPDEVWGEHVKASVVLMPGSQYTSETLISYCRAHMPTFRAPKEIEIVDELPKGATGKVLTSVLREHSVKKA
jgi:acyl-CoA synthetase (AMP-forming)/AMP-acid ligase II